MHLIDPGAGTRALLRYVFYQFLTQIYFLASYDVLDGKTIVHSLHGSTDFIKSSLLFMLKFANQKQGVLYNKVSESD